MKQECNGTLLARCERGAVQQAGLSCHRDINHSQVTSAANRQCTTQSGRPLVYNGRDCDKRIRLQRMPGEKCILL